MLNHVVIGDPSNPIVAVIHGIFGAGNNWRSFVQKWIKRRPDLCIVLVDLRNHGSSPHRENDNTLLQCAQEVLDLQKKIGDYRAIVGHSFGGKVALQCAEIPVYSEIEQIWALDSFPGSLDRTAQDQNEVHTVLSWLRAVPFPVQKRSEVKQFLLERGASAMVSQWMTSNLIRTENGFVWRFNLDGIEQMLTDYFIQDLWHVLEFPNTQISTHLVRALKSDRWGIKSIEKLESLSSEQYYTLDAGHWLHVDNPEDLLDLFERAVLPLA